MTGVIEAAGEVATGAAWGRTAEPRAGEQLGGEGHGACLNCGTTLTGRYCHACGQSSHVHRTLMSIVHDLLHGVFHFEGKIWRTMPMLVTHPGQLTRRYIDGERAKFVSPLALFLFTVFLMFAAFSAIAPRNLTEGFADGLFDSNAQLIETEKHVAARLAGAERAREEAVAAGKNTARADRTITTLREEATALAESRRKLKLAIGERPVKVRSDWNWLEKRLEEARVNPGLTLYKVQSATYKFSWALIFLSTPLVALLFAWRRRFGLYDHATFVTYSITFMSLLVILLTLLSMVSILKPLLLVFMFLVPPAHMFAQLRGAHSLSAYGALWRTVILLFGSTMILATFIVGVVALEISH